MLKYLGKNKNKQKRQTHLTELLKMNVKLNAHNRIAKKLCKM